MAEHTKIAWCNHTFNPWIGCSRVAEGCQNCYAENLMANRYGRVVWGVDGTRSRTKTWRDPVKWNREAAAANEMRKVFCASLADVFEDRDELVPWRRDLFELIDQCQNLYWLLLTKRPENICRMWPADGWHRSNVWLGTSVAVQRNTEYVDRLMEARRLSPVLFVSMEPQVGPVDLSDYINADGGPDIDWVIVGGESRQMNPARAFNTNWARVTIDQCRDANVPVFMKQLGENAYEGSRRLTLKDSHGGDPSEWAEDLRVRECPDERFAIL